MVAPLDTQTNPDLVVNINSYLYVQEVTPDLVDGNTIAYLGTINYGGSSTSVTDNPDGSVSTTITALGFSNNREALPSEPIGIPPTDPMVTYLDTRFTAGEYSLAYFAKHNGFPIVALNTTANSAFPEQTFYFLYTNSPTPISSGSTDFNTTPVSFSAFLYCFEKSTLIKTPNGETPVFRLSVGDEIFSSDQRVIKVKWIGRQTLNPVFAKLDRAMPIKISAGALGNDLPSQDLFVSPDHAMLVQGVLVHAKALVNNRTIMQMQSWPGDVEYYHIETENHELILANGAAAETFIDNVSRKEFDNWAEYETLYPNAVPMTELDIPRVKFARQLPNAITQYLDGIAQEIAPEVMAA